MGQHQTACAATNDLSERGYRLETIRRSTDAELMEVGIPDAINALQLESLSAIFIPSMETWSTEAVTCLQQQLATAGHTILVLMTWERAGTLPPHMHEFVMGEDDDMNGILGYRSIIELTTPTLAKRAAFFAPLLSSLATPPEPASLTIPPTALENLEVAPEGAGMLVLNSEQRLAMDTRCEHARQDLRRHLRNFHNVATKRFRALCRPVDLVEYPDYMDYVSNPIDLGLVMEKTDMGLYETLEDWIEDVRRIANNVRLYNEPRSDIVRKSFEFDDAVNEFVDSVPPVNRLNYIQAAIWARAHKTPLRLEPQTNTDNAQTPSYAINSSTARRKILPRRRKRRRLTIEQDEESADDDGEALDVHTQAADDEPISEHPDEGDCTADADSADSGEEVNDADEVRDALDDVDEADHAEDAERREDEDDEDVVQDMENEEDGEEVEYEEHAEDTEHEEHVDDMEHEEHAEDTEHEEHVDNTEHEEHAEDTGHEEHAEEMEHAEHPEDTANEEHAEEMEHEEHTGHAEDTENEEHAAEDIEEEEHAEDVESEGRSEEVECEEHSEGEEEADDADALDLDDSPEAAEPQESDGEPEHELESEEDELADPERLVDAHECHSPDSAHSQSQNAPASPPHGDSVSYSQSSASPSPNRMPAQEPALSSAGLFSTRLFGNMSNEPCARKTQLSAETVRNIERRLLAVTKNMNVRNLEILYQDLEGEIEAGEGDEDRTAVAQAVTSKIELCERRYQKSRR
ncbi:ATPase AAA domain-containing protein 2 [Geranomyces michiganensis]|nr:ATPase AAA domain-containing protein 2 [Geranomyces michiganensis]